MVDVENTGAVSRGGVWGGISGDPSHRSLVGVISASSGGFRMIEWVKVPLTVRINHNTVTYLREEGP